MINEEFSIKRTFITHTRRQIVRRFTRSLPNLRVLPRGWHKKMFIKVSPEKVQEKSTQVKVFKMFKMFKYLIIQQPAGIGTYIVYTNRKLGIKLKSQNEFTSRFCIFHIDD